MKKPPLLTVGFYFNRRVRQLQINFKIQIDFFNSYFSSLDKAELIKTYCL
jgi:hypothetical protein